MENTTNNQVSVLNFSDAKKTKLQEVRRIGSALNHIEAAISDMEQFSDLKGVDAAIQSLVSLQHQLSDQLESLS